MELHIFCDVFSEPEDYKGTCRGRRTQVKKKEANLPKRHKLKNLGMDFMFLSFSFHVVPSAISCFPSLSIFMTTPMKVH